jgi:transcriptional regulatory protein RtcR
MAMKRRKSVAFGFLGVKLDAPTGADRWSRFRPTISLCTNETLRVDRLELFHPGDGRAQTTFDRIAADLRDRAPHVELLPRAVPELDPWDFEAVFAHLHDFARTYPFDLEKEEYLVHLTTGTHVAQICLFLLTETRHFPARLVQTAPAKGEDGAPRGGLSIIDLDLARYDRLAERFTAERRRAAEVLKSGIATRNAAFNRLVARVEQVALASTAPMLLLGPTGAGKSQLAKRIYELKRERHVVQGAFVELNCATLRGDAAMSALFGHRKGAYTGATADRPGLLRAADKGLLFLDEIGELGLDEQAMLLRALEERRFLPLGGDVEAESDFQLVAGSNRDLGAAVAAGRFREDLMARIDLWTFRLPGLRDRTEDIEPNVDHEIERFAARTGRRVRFAKEARTAYLAFATSPAAAWNANFRDLNASVTRLATLAESGRITLDLVAEERARLESSWNRPAAGATSPGVGSAAFPGAAPTAAGLERVLKPAALAELDLFDRVQLAAVVDVCRRSRTLSEAGRTLFNASREKKSSANDADRLRKYLARFDLAFADLG